MFGSILLEFGNIVLGSSSTLSCVLLLLIGIILICK